MKWISLLLVVSLTTACNSPETSTAKEEVPKTSKLVKHIPIGDYVTGTYEDSKGHLWFGTIERGIARYDGSVLKYFTTADGLPSNRVISVLEDATGNYWFNTGEGLCKYDGVIFQQFIVKEGDFGSNMISQLYIDSKNQFWVGTWAGVYLFDEENFTPFPLPNPEIITSINLDTENWITEIQEDAAGHMWFARDGYGAYQYDGTSFTHYRKQDGLLSNNVMEITFDDEGHVWFGMRVGEKDHPDPNQRSGPGGVNRLVDGKIVSFPDIDGFTTNDVYEIHKDRLGNIWIATVENGVYKYDGMAFQHFEVPISIMSITDDRKGNIWLGGAGGLYKIDKVGQIMEVTVQGPWE